MGRRTIDFGIDLGTTNSEIAFMENGKLHVFKNFLQEEFTPSVVRIDEKGTVRVGRKAYERIVYDLGGGTFDVAILSAKEGSLSVVDHFGDNFLGGVDFDWKIVENIIHP